MANAVTNEQLETILRRMDSLESGLKSEMKIIEVRVNSLPDKAEIYRASFLLHGAIWAAIATTIGLSLAFASAAHLFK